MVFNMKKYLIIITLLFVFLFSSNTVKASGNPSEMYSYKDYVIDAYHVDIKVNENNTFDITEKITAYFNVPKHGIFRTIPLRNEVTREDGTTTKNRVQITNLEVSDEVKTSRENGNYKLQIGSPNYTFTGKKIYTISYNYNIGKDPLKDKDEFYYNIIGTEWDTYIGNVTFSITMPKEFDKSKLGFSAGVFGTVGTDKINYSVDGNVITGSYNIFLSSGEGLTVRLELPEGYFVGAGYKVKTTDYLLFIIPLICLIISYMIWKEYGKDEQVVETVEFYPPEGLNSLEVGQLYKGKADKEDVVSLLIYLANKGYIQIVETSETELWSERKKFMITKLKPYDGNNENEKLFLEGLFKSPTSVNLTKVKELMQFAQMSGEKLSFAQALNNTVEETEKTTVTKEDLYDSFYITVNKILRNINCKENKNKIFEKKASSKKVLIILTILVSLLTTIAIPTLEYGGIEQMLGSLFLMMFYLPFYIVAFSNWKFGIVRIFIILFIMGHSLAFFSVMPIAQAIIDSTLYLISTIFGLACLVGMILCLKYLPKRTKYGNEMLGRIKGFKDFLETAEKEKLEAMVLKNPTYFYDILPYTYVLGVSDKWISKFESIAMEAPDWYDSPHGFDSLNFGRFIDNTMTSASRAMTSRPSSDSGGGSSFGDFSGGGSSGGGSGGGGGGSW